MNFARLSIAAAISAACLATALPGRAQSMPTPAHGGDMQDGGPHGGPPRHDGQMPASGPMQHGGPMQGGPMHGGPMEGGPMQHGGPGLPFLHGVELTEAQQDKVFAITYAAEPSMREQGKAARAAHEALRALAGSAQYDDKKASALAQTIGQSAAAAALQQARIESQVLALLTPEQRKQLADAQAPHAGFPHP